jgi:hypothetical protein|tara:strand:+ start:376 stop:600 length:225 start_codon:yes stop_codon:yes gene_type:complete
MRNMNPDEIELTNPSQSFEYERLSREIDECDDVEVLQQMCKFLVKLEMKQRATYSVILQDTLPELANLGSTDGN